MDFCSRMLTARTFEPMYLSFVSNGGILRFITLIMGSREFEEPLEVCKK